MNYYGRILGLISEVKVRARRSSSSERPTILRKNPEAPGGKFDKEDARRAIENMPGYSRSATRAARERELHRRGKQDTQSAGPSL